jgi:putative tricarboxylic transport membrane protein
MKKADLITGFVLLVLSGYMIWESWMMPDSATFGPGSGFLPFWLGILMAVLSVILMAGALFRKPDPTGKEPFPRGKALLRVAAVMVGLGVYISLMEVLGFVLNTFLFVSYLMLAVEREKWKLAGMVAVLTTAGLYIIFQVLLGITLPKNMFGL